MVGEKVFKSPLERMLKKSYEEMTRREFIIVRAASSLAAGVLFAVGKYLWDKFSHRLVPGSFYVVAFLLFSISWYFLFWAILCRMRGIKK